uniref:Stum, mechanosensory transduction mediator homolog n=1 Tax=Zosterops lateralis melanops TaxID=1220523 RepID=A0A8D2QUQ4_ZOSLA
SFPTTQHSPFSAEVVSVGLGWRGSQTPRSAFSTLVFECSEYGTMRGAGARGMVWQEDGTFVSAFTVLCGARTDLPDRHMCCVFWLNIAAALIQILTAIVMVGWIMSIFWGMDMVILASKSMGKPQTKQV